MKITKKEFVNEINFEDVEVGQIFHFGIDYYMAFGKKVADYDDYDTTHNAVWCNAICLNDGRLVRFDDKALVAVVDNVELIVVG